MYEQKIRMLEESYRVVEIQLAALQKEESKNLDKIKQLQESKIKYLNELRELRRMLWDHNERVDFDDDR